MSYALVWIETLVVALLWVATFAAVSAKAKWKGERILLIVALIVLPLLILWKWVAIYRAMPFWLHGAVYGWTAFAERRWYALNIFSYFSIRLGLIFYCAVGALLLYGAMRRNEHRAVRGLLLALFAAVPFVALCMVVNTTAWLRYMEQVQTGWFLYAVCLLATELIGTVIVIILATRRREAGMDWAAAGWSISKLSLACLTALAITAMTLWNMDLAVQSQASIVRLEAGNLMLATSPPSVSDALNAAPLYISAFKRMDVKNEDFLLEKPPTPTNGLTTGPTRPRELVGPYFFSVYKSDEPEILDLLKRHEQTIALLRQAAARPECRFDQWDNTYHEAFRQVVSLMHLHARLELSKGNVESALMDANVLFRLHDHLTRTLLRNLRAPAIDLAAVDVLQEVLPAVTRPDQLRVLDLGDAASNRKALHGAFQADEAWGLGFFSDLALERGRLPQEIGGDYVFNGGGTYVLGGNVSDAGRFFVRVFFLPSDLEVYRSFMKQCQQQSLKPYYQVRDKITEVRPWRHHDDKKATLITASIAPPAESLFNWAARAEAAHLTAQTAVAALQYRFDNGEFPTALNRLVPRYLDDVPVDPYDGHPLRIVQAGDEWTVYSVGPDGVDDGGKVKAGWKSFSNRAGEKGDILFRVSVGEK